MSIFKNFLSWACFLWNLFRNFITGILSLFSDRKNFQNIYIAMKSKTLLPFLIGFFLILIISWTKATQQKQKQVKPPKPSGSYEYFWSKVDSFEQKGLNRSALDQVLKIYDKAKQEQNSAQLVKAVIHRLKFQSYVEENQMLELTEGLKTDLKNANYPERPLLHSMLAEVYWQYYQHNRYRILNRTETVNYKETDIETWSAPQFVRAVLNEYAFSMRDADQAKKTQINIFDLVLEKGNNEGRKFRPSLYDFLAHRALAFYTNEESGLTRPADHFELNSAFYLNNADMFLNFMLTSKDTSDFKYKAIVLFQELIAFHHDDVHPGAFIDVDLMRLKFVHDNMSIPTKDSLYGVALQKIADQYKEYPGCTDALYEQANLALEEGGKYSEKRETKYKWKIRLAESLCDEAISRFPYSDGGIRCKELKKRINETALSFTVEDVNIPASEFRTLVEYKNINELFFRIVKDNKGQELNEETESDPEWRIKNLLKEVPVKEWNLKLPTDSDKQSHSVEAVLPALPLGRYAILISAKKEFTYGKSSIAYSRCRISAMSAVNRRLDNGSTEVYVFDRENGQALANVEARVITREYNYNARKYISKEVARTMTDADGRMNIPVKTESYRNFNLELIRGEDHLFLDENFYQYPSPRNTEVKQERTFFFTDRAIYRPGQTIHFKGMMVEGKDETAEILSNRATTVTFYDVNGQKILDQDFITSEYGTFHGTFTAPQGVLTGQMRIQNKSGSAYFRIEEYKRPKFEVVFDPLKSTYRLGEQVSLTGKAQAFSGQAIDGAEVQFRVVRMARYPKWCYWFPRVPEQQILNGTTGTDANGNFTVSFTLQPDMSIPRENDPIFTYKVSADVTDINGETRSTESFLNAGYSALELSADLGEEVDIMKKDSFIIFSKNLMGEHTPAMVTLEIYELAGPDRILRNRMWHEPDKHIVSEKEYAEKFPFDVYANEEDKNSWQKKQLVWKGELNTAKDSVVHLFKKDFPEGQFVLEGNAKDQYGQVVHLKQFFMVYNALAKLLPGKKLDWFKVLKNDALPGDADQVLIGSSDRDVKVLYELELKGKILSKEWINLDRSQQLVTIPVKEEYRGNFTVHFTFVKRGRAFMHSQTMNVPWENKDLKLTYETFRSKLTPGQKEEWRIHISGSKGEKVSAEMLASMYDASLDAFAPNAWSFSIYNTRGTTLNFRSGSFGAIHSQWYDRREPEMPIQHEFRTYDYLNWFGYAAVGYGGGPGRMYKELESLYSVAGVVRAEMADGNMEETKAVASLAAPVIADSVNTGGAYPPVNAPKPAEAASVRRNLTETAFFYPQLMTNDSGDVIFSFTSPEALTRWKFMTFSHTKDLRFSLDEKTLVTQKQLMVVPNAPRFLREGDRIVFPAKISSLSDSSLNGVATLELFDAITMQPLDKEFSNSMAKKNFSLRKGESSAISWELTIPEGVNAVVYRVTAVAGNYSDGEEQAVPVLSNKLLVTESLPIWQRGSDTKTFELTKLLNNTSPTLRNVKLTLEYTSNPAWSAIQALPYLMEYPYQCSEQIFSRYYANAIATHIANSSPKIKAVFESWKSSSPDAFLSNLEKNQDLKNLILEETPWVMEAKDETERKKRIGLLFDLNKMSSELSTALNQLMKAQSSNGGWPWFEGMPEDRYITQHIVSGLGHLDHLGIQSVRNESRIKNMLNRAVQYLDQRMLEDYRELIRTKADRDKVHPGAEQIHYLYARSFFSDIKMGKDVQEAYSFYLKQSKKFWLGTGEYLEAMIALAVFRNREEDDDNRAVAIDIINSLRENAQNKEEMGMYWANNNGGYSWNRASIETQALLIEAFDEIAKDKKSVEDMKIWLLRQKQTQDWKTTKATAEACYALLLSGTDWLGQNKQPEIRLGTKQVNIPSDAEAGSGYFKTSWNGKEISNDMGKVSVKTTLNIPANTSETKTGISWGAIYWQYFESLDKITAHATPLSLKKELFVERASATGPVIELLQPNTVLKTGDRVKVRIELRVDRDMEYVHMKDLRASGLEPENVLSEYKYQDGLGYYESTRDASTNFFFSYLNKGVYVFEYPLRATQEGDFSNGITTIECMYAPEFSAHSLGERILIRGK